MSARPTTRRWLLAVCLGGTLTAETAAANPVPCCQLKFTPSATVLTLNFIIHQSCLRDAGPPVDPSQVKLFKDGVQVTPIDWTVSSDAHTISLSASVPWSPSEPIHKYEVSAPAVYKECRAQVTIGGADAGPDHDRATGDVLLSLIDQRSSGSPSGCTVTHFSHPARNSWPMAPAMILVCLGLRSVRYRRQRRRGSAHGFPTP